jgi:hypothetical protein
MLCLLRPLEGYSGSPLHQLLDAMVRGPFGLRVFRKSSVSKS